MGKFSLQAIVLTELLFSVSSLGKSSLRVTPFMGFGIIAMVPHPLTHGAWGFPIYDLYYQSLTPGSPSSAGGDSSWLSYC